MWSRQETFNRMLKKSASIVLAALRGSTYRSVRLASSLAAALLDSLFEHPATILTSAPSKKFHGCLYINRDVPQPARHRPTGFLVYLIGRVCLASFIKTNPQARQTYSSIRLGLRAYTELIRPRMNVAQRRITKNHLDIRRNPGRMPHQSYPAAQTNGILYGTR